MPVTTDRPTPPQSDPEHDAAAFLIQSVIDHICDAKNAVRHMENATASHPAWDRALCRLGAAAKALGMFAPTYGDRDDCPHELLDAYRAEEVFESPEGSPDVKDGRCRHCGAERRVVAAP